VGAEVEESFVKILFFPSGFTRAGQSSSPTPLGFLPVERLQNVPGWGPGAFPSHHSPATADPAAFNSEGAPADDVRTVGVMPCRAPGDTVLGDPASTRHVPSSAPHSVLQAHPPIPRFLPCTAGSSGCFPVFLPGCISGKLCSRVCCGHLQHCMSQHRGLRGSGVWVGCFAPVWFCRDVLWLVQEAVLG